MCTCENIEGQNLQHRVRVEATVSHSGCVLSFVQVAIIREMKNGGSDLDRRSQSPQTMMVVVVGGHYQYGREKCEETVFKMGADSGSIRWPATSVHKSVSF